MDPAAGSKVGTVSAGVRMAPTRSSLLRAARRLERVGRGTGLLRRKREALVTELFRLARPAADARAAVAERAARAWPVLLDALAEHGLSGLRAMGWPTRELTVVMRTGSVWGVTVAEIVDRHRLARSLGARGTAPSLTHPAAAAAATAFEQLTELLVDAAPREMLIRRLGDALARTSRQVHTLEQRVAPALRSGMARVRRTLEEREREEHLRLKHLITRRVS
jgi:V/A-type H+-transporting ATPase subunit D